MLTLQALQSALPLAQRLVNKGYMAEPISGTPLDALVCASQLTGDVIASSTGMTQTDNPLANVNLEFLERMANMVDENGNCTHDVVLDDIFKVLVTAVPNHLKFARTIVRPAVTDLVERVQVALQSRSIESITGVEIKVEEVPAPLYENSFVTLVRKAQNVIWKNPATRLALPDATLEEIRAIMKTGSASIDAAVDEWIAATGDSWLLDLWDGVFTLKPIAAGQAKRTFNDWVTDKQCGTDYTLAIYLIANGLGEHIPDGVNMTLALYQSTCAEYREQAASQLCRVLDRLDREAANKTLVTAIKGRCTVVNPLVYRAWIEAGGDNDVLFGNSLRQQPYVSVGDITTNAIDLKKAWMDHCNLVTLAERGQRFARLKEAFLEGFLSQLRDLPAQDSGAPLDVQNYDAMIERFKRELIDVREPDTECLHMLATRLLCCSRFADTAAYDILAGMELAAKQNEGITANEAALLSTIDYICDYVAALIQVRKA